MNTTKRKRVTRIGSTQKKILLMLLGGVALGLSSSPKQYFKILEEMQKEWKAIDEKQLRRAIRSLYQSQLVEEWYNRDGTTTIVLSNEGKQRALTYNLETLKIQTPARWDGKWHLVIFDIPERQRKARDSIRFHLKELGFYELQRSVFVHPFPCSDEIDYLVEHYGMRQFVRFTVAEYIDNELHLKRIFGLR